MSHVVVDSVVTLWLRVHVVSCGFMSCTLKTFYYNGLGGPGSVVHEVGQHMVPQQRGCRWLLMVTFRLFMCCLNWLRMLCLAQKHLQFVTGHFLLLNLLAVSNNLLEVPAWLFFVRATGYLAYCVPANLQQPLWCLRSFRCGDLVIIQDTRSHMYEKEPLHNQGRTVIGLYKIWFKHIIDIEL